MSNEVDVGTFNNFAGFSGLRFKVLLVWIDLHKSTRLLGLEVKFDVIYKLTQLKARKCCTHLKKFIITVSFIAMFKF